MLYIKPPRETIRPGTTDEEIEEHVADSERFFFVTKLLEENLDSNIQETLEEILMLLKLIYGEEIIERVAHHRVELFNRRDIARSEAEGIRKRKMQDVRYQKQMQEKAAAEIAEAEEEDYYSKLEHKIREKWFNAENKP